jgi:hypothetical protein
MHLHSLNIQSNPHLYRRKDLSYKGMVGARAVINSGPVLTIVVMQSGLTRAKTLQYLFDKHFVPRNSTCTAANVCKRLKMFAIVFYSTIEFLIIWFVI